MNLRTHPQRGLTLVEILISLVLGVFLLGGILQVYLSNKQAYRLNDAISRVQENGRFAIDFLARDLRMAGYMGCGGRLPQITNTLNSTSDLRYDFDFFAQGHEAGTNSWTPAVDTGVIDSPLPGRDIVILRGAFSEPTRIIGQPSSAADCATASAAAHTADLKVADSSGLTTGDVVLATNCSQATIFQITNVNALDNVVHNTGNTVSPGNATRDLGACYAGSGRLMKFETRIYYIRNNDDGEPSLYRIRGNAAPEELIEGVENMQILYGVDTDNDRSANKYETADVVANLGEWSRVVSLRLQLLLRSVTDRVTSTSQPYTFDGVTVTPDDRRLRRVFSTTVALRNLTP